MSNVEEYHFDWGALKAKENWFGLKKAIKKTQKQMNKIKTRNQRKWKIERT